MPNHPNPQLDNFEDVLGFPKIETTIEIGAKGVGKEGDPGYQAPREGGYYYNIDDPLLQKEEGRWGVQDMNLKLDPLTEEPKTCQDVCDDKMTLRRKNCALLRRRVAVALKKAGCPSKVIPFKVAKVVCARKKPAKKKTTKKKK